MPTLIPAHRLPAMKPVSPRTGTDGGVSLRAVGVGLVVAAFVNLWVTYCEYIIRSSQMNLSHFPEAILSLYVLMAIPLRKAGFRPGEMATVLAMGLVAACIPTNGLMGFWLGVITAPYYFASAQNRWAEIFHPSLPGWIAPLDRYRAIEYFYNGLPPGGETSLAVWITPIFWWLSLIAAIVMLMLCIAAVLRKPWIEHERLVFPIAEAGIALARRGPGEGSVPAMFRSRLFHAGFWAVVIIFVWNCIGYLQPLWPPFPLWYGMFRLFPGFPEFGLRINFLTLGLCYFANTSALLSVWVFFLILGTQSMICNRLGFTVGPLVDNWSSFDAIAAWESFGALAMLVVWGLWTAREHLGKVFRAAFRGGPENDDPRELMSFRVAVFGGIVAFAYILAWLHTSGMDWTFAIAWTLATLVIFVGVARIVSETGIPYVRGPLTAQGFVLDGFGTIGRAPSSAAALTFTFAFISQGKGLFMTQIMHGARFASEVPSARKLTTAIVSTGVRRDRRVPRGDPRVRLFARRVQLRRLRLYRRRAVRLLPDRGVHHRPDARQVGSLGSLRYRRAIAARAQLAPRAVLVVASLAHRAHDRRDVCDADRRVHDLRRLGIEDDHPPHRRATAIRPGKAAVSRTRVRIRRRRAHLVRRGRRLVPRRRAYPFVVKKPEPQRHGGHREIEE